MENAFGTLTILDNPPCFAVGLAWRALEKLLDEQGFRAFYSASVLPALLKQIPAHEQIGSVTADGACNTRKCHDAIADRGADTVILPRKNANPWKKVSAGALAIVLGPMADNGSPRNEALRASKYLGRALWRPLSAASSRCACRAVDGADTTAEAASRRNLAGSCCA